MNKITVAAVALTASMAFGCVSENIGTFSEDAGEHERQIGRAVQAHLADVFPASRARIEDVDLTALQVTYFSDVGAVCNVSWPQDGCFYFEGRLIALRRGTERDIGIIAHQYVRAVLSLAGIAGNHNHPAFDGAVPLSYGRRLASGQQASPVAAPGSLARTWADASKCARQRQVGGVWPAAWPNGERLDCDAAVGEVAPYYRAMVPVFDRRL